LIINLAVKLIKNGFRFRYLKWSGKPGKPQAISLEITHRCIARCTMCNIWRIPPDVPDLLMHDWIDLLSSDLFLDLRELDITGGEPFLRKDLPDLISSVCELKQRNLRELRSIAITTNGLLTHRVLEYTEKMLTTLKDAHTELVMVCAMDAIGEKHDKIRNYQNAWSCVDQTIERLLGLKKKFSNLIIGVKTTVLPINIDELDDITRYAHSRGLFTIISPRIVTEGRYLNVEQADHLTFSRNDVQKMIHFFKGDRFKWNYHGDRLVRYLQTGIIKKPCSCGFNYFFVRYNGELFLCPLINLSMGNVTKQPVNALFFSEKATRMRKGVGRFPQCRNCTEPGIERYSLPYEGFTYLSFLLRMGKSPFRDMHRHMGLEKYF